MKKLVFSLLVAVAFQNSIVQAEAIIVDHETGHSRSRDGATEDAQEDMSEHEPWSCPEGSYPACGQPVCTQETIPFTGGTQWVCRINCLCVS